MASGTSSHVVTVTLDALDSDAEVPWDILSPPLVSNDNLVKSGLKVSSRSAVQINHKVSASQFWIHGTCSRLGGTRGCAYSGSSGCSLFWHRGMRVDPQSTVFLPLGNAAFHRVVTTLRTRGIAAYHRLHDCPTPSTQLTPRLRTINDIPIVLDTDCPALRNHIQRILPRPILTWLVPNGGQAPIS
jgi:hypothetical protein